MGQIRGKKCDRDAKCPFFCAHLKQQIICEGILPESRLWNNFSTPIEKEKQYKIFCCARYKYCEVYTAINKKYEEEEA